MNTILFKVTRVLVILLILLFFISCENDTVENTEQLTSEVQKPISYPFLFQKSGAKVSKNAISFLKQKTNNTLRVAFTKKSVRLTDGNQNTKETILGTIDTEKAIMVINETNIKHTFKINTLHTTENSITNIILVETIEGMYEYFIRYTFTNGIDFNIDGSINLTSFTGTIATYNRSGTLTEITTITDGGITDVEEVGSPCPEDDLWTGWDDYWDTPNYPPGGGGTADTDIPNTSETSNTDSSGAGSNGDCGLNISYQEQTCNGGVSGQHESTENSTVPGGMCSGAGAPVIVVTDCNNVILASGRNNNLRDLETDPCKDGIAGVLIDEDDLCSLDDENFNTYYSIKSPFTVNLSQVRENCDGITTPENAKFMCIYNKLTALPAFRELFINTFGESSEASVTFELADLPDNIAGQNIADVGNVKNQIIRMNINHLTTKHPLTNAQSIIHECIHAYLKVKKFECSTGTTVEDLNNQELDELLNEFDYTCLSTATSEHDLMFDILVPYMQQILEDIQLELIAIENENPDINFYPGVLGEEELHTFNWNSCLYYMTLAGLDGANAFNSEINSNEYEQDLYRDYNNSINSTLLFNFNTCNE